MTNMAIEAGGKMVLWNLDEITLEYISKRASRAYEIYKSDSDAVYSKTIDYNVENIQPKVALPHLPENVVDVDEAENITIDQVVIGSY